MKSSGTYIVVKQDLPGRYLVTIAEDEHGSVCAMADGYSIAGAINRAIGDLTRLTAEELTLPTTVVYTTSDGRKADCATLLGGWSYDRSERIASKLVAKASAR